MGECASTNARWANVCDDFIYGIVNITFGDECCGGRGKINFEKLKEIKRTT